jgi:tripartite-type tricarboxylate transporter receptor subunit TctC
MSAIGRRVIALAALLAIGTVATAQAQTPIRIVVPYAPGGITDVIARALGTRLSEAWKQQVVIENKPGGNSQVGAELVAKSAPDGTTLMVTSDATFVMNPHLYSKLSYDAVNDFTQITGLGISPQALILHPSVPARTVSELVALAKQKPGELQYASAGVGSFQHLGGELFKLEAGVNMLHVPFKGGGPAMIDVVGGHTKLLFSSLVQTTPHIRSGKLKALGTGGSKRNAVLPDVPTVAEAGVPTYEAVNWWGLVAPAGTPAPIIEHLHKAVQEVQNSAEVQKQFASEGAEIVRTSPAEFGAFMEKEMTKWGRVVKEGGIKAE